MRPLAAAGSWPLVDVEKGRWLRLSILPRDAGSKSATKLLWQLKHWKAYLLAGLEAFAGVQPCSEEISYSEKGRHIIEAKVLDLNNFRLLQHHDNTVTISEAGLTASWSWNVTAEA